MDEVEVLLLEDELLRACYYCGEFENAWDEPTRFERIAGEGYATTYMCSEASHRYFHLLRNMANAAYEVQQCSGLSEARRVLRRISRRGLGWS